MIDIVRYFKKGNSKLSKNVATEKFLTARRGSIAANVVLVFLLFFSAGLMPFLFWKTNDDENVHQKFRLAIFQEKYIFFIFLTASSQVLRRF